MTNRADLRTEQRRERTLVFAVGGAIGAIVLGAALTPLRGDVSAPNLGYVFLLLVLLVAEWGGHLAAFATAIVSAASLNFFLTEPYLSLDVSKRQDLFAVVALLIVGLVVGAFSTMRRSAVAESGVLRDDLGDLRRAVDGIAADADWSGVLEIVRTGFGLAGVALRDASGVTIASSGRVTGEPVHVDPRTLRDPEETRHVLGARGFALPESGAAVSLDVDGSAVGSLDLFGRGDGLSHEDTHALVVLARVLALELDRRTRAVGTG